MAYRPSLGCFTSALRTATLAAVAILGLFGPANADEIRIKYWTFIDPTQANNPRGRNLADEIALFEKANPGIKVDVDVMPWHQVTPQVIQASAAGRTPDVARVLGWNMPELVAAGAPSSLNEYVAGWSPEARSDFLVGWDSTVWGGQKLVVPMELRTSVLWYRADFLEKAGLQPPKTFDELIVAGKAMAKLPNSQGFVLGLSRANEATALSEPFYSLLWAAGGDLVDEKGNPAFNSEAGAKALGKLKEMVDQGAMPRAAIGYNYEDVFSGVKAGTVGMTFMGSMRVKTARETANLGDKLQTLPIPGFTADKPAPAHVFGWNLMIGKDSKHKDASWKFVQHMTSTEAQVRRAVATGELPTRKSAYENEFFQTPDAKEIQGWVSYVEAHGRTPKYPPRYTEMVQLIADAVQEVIVRKTDPKAALDKAADRFRALR